MNTGKEYEQLIETLYQQLAPNAIVTHNDSIIGRNSEVKRQIDVSVKYKFAGVDHLIIVEAKDFKNPVNVKALDGFSNVIKDVGANKGIIVSAKGFSKAALNMGKNLGIECLTIHSAINKKWETLLKVKVQKTMHFFEMDHKMTLYVGHISGTGGSVPMNMFTYDGLKIIPLTEIIYKEIIAKISWKEIRKSNIHYVDLKNIGVYHIIDNKACDIQKGYVAIKYIKSIVKNFYILPDNYLFEINHLNNIETLHNLTVNIDELEKIPYTEFDHDDTITDEPHIISTIYKFKDEYEVFWQFNIQGHISGNVFLEDNTIIKMDERSSRISKIEKILKQNTSNSF